MPSGIIHNVDEAARALARVEQGLEPMLLGLARFADARIAGRAVGTYMRNAKGEGSRSPDDRGPLRIVTARLARAVRGGFEERAGRARESKVVLKVENARLTYLKIIYVPYARAQEEGFRGTVTVPAHTREINQAFTRKVQGPREVVHVSSYTRRMNIPARPTLGPALDREAPAIEKRGERDFLKLLEMLEVE